jgi:hypothetical protein
VTGSIAYVLMTWGHLWDGLPTPRSSQISEKPPKHKTQKGLQKELEAKLTDLDLDATEDHLAGTASKVIDALLAAFGDAKSRKYQFYVWRMTTNAHPTMSHDIQAVVMQNLCATFDGAVVLLQMLKKHPCVRGVTYDILMKVETWPKHMHKMLQQMFEKFDDRHVSHIKLWTLEEVRDNAINAVQHVIAMRYHSDAIPIAYDLFALLHDPARVYQIRHIPRYGFSLGSKPDDQRSSCFSPEELRRFAVEREELRDPTMDLLSGEDKEKMAEAIASVVTLKQEIKKLQEAAEEDILCKTAEIEKLQNVIQEGATREKKRVYPGNAEGEYVPPSNKRSHMDMMETPRLHVRGLAAILGSLFEFLENLEGADGMFQVRDALRHAYMHEAAAVGEELDYTDADEMAKARLKVLSPAFRIAGVKQSRFERVSSYAMSYPELADLLLQDKKLRWFRRLHLTIVGDAMLPSPEVHIALAAHLESVRSRIDVSTIAAVLGVSRVTAKRIAPHLQQETSAGALKTVQCLKMVKGLRRRDVPRQCKKTTKIKQLLLEGGGTAVLCCYHKASKNANRVSNKPVGHSR